MNIIKNTAVVAAVALVLAVAGCTKESAFDTQADVAQAEASRTQDVSGARVDNSVMGMTDDRMGTTDMQNDMHNDVNGLDTNSTLAAALAESDATYRIAIGRCESQSGAARTQCKDVADAELTAARARAEAANLAAQPNG